MDMEMLVAHYLGGRGRRTRSRGVGRGGVLALLYSCFTERGLGVSPITSIFILQDYTTDKHPAHSVAIIYFKFINVGVISRSHSSYLLYLHISALVSLSCYRKRRMSPALTPTPAAVPSLSLLPRLPLRPSAGGNSDSSLGTCHLDTYPSASPTSSSKVPDGEVLLPTRPLLLPNRFTAPDTVSVGL